MPFPESPRVVYSKNTLVEVICQLRFPTILRIGTGDLANFQDKIRQEYPLYNLQEPSIALPQLPKEMAAIVEQMNLPKPPGSAIHRFSTTDSQRFISMSQDFLALTESAYMGWELFTEEMKKAERALQEVYSPAFYYRVGLRYRNVISRQKLELTETKWKDLLKPHITAELGDLEVSDSIEVTQTRSLIRIPEVPGGQVRLLHGLFKPADSDEACYEIDADFSITEKEGINEPFDIMDKFNRLAGRLFRWAVTDKLHRAMEPKPFRLASD